MEAITQIKNSATLMLTTDNSMFIVEKTFLGLGWRFLRRSMQGVASSARPGIIRPICNRGYHPGTAGTSLRGPMWDPTDTAAAPAWISPHAALRSTLPKIGGTVSPTKTCCGSNRISSREMLSSTPLIWGESVCDNAWHSYDSIFVCSGNNGLS